MKVNALDLATGRAFSANEFLYGENVCIVGNEVIKRLFDGRESSALDRVISAGGNRFRIVGVMTTQGSSMTSNMDNQIEIPLLAQKLYGYSDQNYNIAVSVPKA
ncbi:MAG: ABC transporter permease [Saprospiraceae bacterium]|nr:ABC transporter permease [Candidatus Parvibacillus calidus]